MEREKYLYFNIKGKNVESCVGMKLNVNISSVQPKFSMNCVGPDACKFLNGIISSNDNNSDNSISNYYVNSVVNCQTNSSCMDTVFIFNGFNKVTMNCNGNRSCKWAWITLWDINQNDTELNVNCYDGSNVCQEAVINGLTTSHVNVTCHYNTFGNECKNMEVTLIFVLY